MNNTAAAETVTFELVNPTGMADSTAEAINYFAATHGDVRVMGHKVLDAKGWEGGEVSVLVEGKREGAKHMFWFGPEAIIPMVRNAD